MRSFLTFVSLGRFAPAALKHTNMLFLSAIGVLTIWILAGTNYAMLRWFEPSPDGVFRIDASDEIGICAALLNWVIPGGLVLSCLGGAISFRARVAVPATFVLITLFLLSSLFALVWWHHMAIAHGPEVTLSKYLLWWSW